MDAHSDDLLESQTDWFAAVLLTMPTALHENVVQGASVVVLSRVGGWQHLVLQSTWLKHLILPSVLFWLRLVTEHWYVLQSAKGALVRWQHVVSVQLTPGTHDMVERTAKPLGHEYAEP
jgi:hypothetical protein